jgi:hypothetical protein
MVSRSAAAALSRAAQHHQRPPHAAMLRFHIFLDALPVTILSHVLERQCAGHLRMVLPVEQRRYAKIMIFRVPGVALEQER